MAPTVDFGPVQYGCTKYKRRMVLYESVNHPGKRFEFCYSSSYQDKRGVETAYYKCVGCMHAKRYNDGRRIPKIAVREARLVNSNPDRPSNFPHFCQPIDSALSDRRQRERVTGNYISNPLAAPSQQQYSSPTPPSPAFQFPQSALKCPITQTTPMALFAAQNSTHTATSATIAAGGTTPASAISAAAAAATLHQIHQQQSHQNQMQNASSQIRHLLPAAAAHSLSAAHQIHPSGVVHAAMQQQIQQLAANCFAASPNSAAVSTMPAASQNFLFGMGMAAASGGWPSVTAPSTTTSVVGGHYPAAQQMRG